MIALSSRSDPAFEIVPYLPKPPFTDREFIEKIGKIDAYQIGLISFDIAVEILSNVLGVNKALIQKQFLKEEEQSNQPTQLQEASTSDFEEQGQASCIRKFHWFVKSLPQQTNNYFSKQFSNPSNFMLFGIIFSVFINHVSYLVSISLDRMLSQEQGKLVFSVSDSCGKVTFVPRTFTIEGLEEERRSILR